MAIQYSVTVNQAKLDSIETTISTTPSLKIYSGSAPANCAAADTGTLLATLTLPSDWLAAATAASPSVKAKAGSWTGTASDGAGATPTHFRIFQGATCHMQGTMGVGSGDMSVDGTITSGQTVTVNSFSISGGNY